MIEDDEEQMKEELKEAFRIYDKEGQGFITTDVLKEILREIDPTLTEEDLDNIIEEVDEDGSGTLDFDEFQEMMMGWINCRELFIWNIFKLKEFHWTGNYLEADLKWNILYSQLEWKSFSIYIKAKH